jgi:hypothetical protein
MLAFQGLVSWLETKPPDGVYTDDHPSNCLISEYLGGAAPAVLPPAIGFIVYTGIKTYGAALQRARAVLGAARNEIIHAYPVDAHKR